MDAALREHCLSELRTLDRDRYLACLLAPEKARDGLVSLALFNAEIARLRDAVREPMAGEIRLQWWRDVISGEGTPAGNPAAEALIETIERHDLPRASLTAYLDARTFDLYDDPMPDRTSFEGYAGETASTILQLGALTLDPDAARQSPDASGHAGVAQTVAGTLLLMPIHTARGQVFLPGDLLAACGLNRESFLATDDLSAVQAAKSALVALGRDHLAKARAAMKPLPAGLRSAFLPVALVGQVLDRAERLTGDPRRVMTPPPQWRRQLRLASAVLGRPI